MELREASKGSGDRAAHERRDPGHRDSGPGGYIGMVGREAIHDGAVTVRPGTNTIQLFLFITLSFHIL